MCITNRNQAHKSCRNSSRFGFPYVATVKMSKSLSFLTREERPQFTLQQSDFPRFPGGIKRSQLIASLWFVQQDQGLMIGRLVKLDGNEFSFCLD